MMKLFLQTLLLACTTQLVLAQSPGGPAANRPLAAAGTESTPSAVANGNISGTIVDAATQNPVGFATITLAEPNTGKAVDGALADEKGKFNIPKVSAGTYKVLVSFIGYETRTIDNVKVSDRGSDVKLGAVKINSSATALKEVQVQGQRALVEEKVDRTVYNAENDASNRGGDATDVLRKVPMLSVDLDGNVSLRGSSNLRVLINNRPSTITAGSVADALKQIPADLIKSVEVITSPSAKYDAEGSGGIINIILKKNTLQGGTLGIDIGTGLRGSNLGLNGSYKQGKMGFSLGGFGRAMYNTTGSFENIQTTNDLTTQAARSITRQSALTRNNNIFGRYSFGWDYDINKNNFLNASVQYGIRNGNSFQDDLLTVTQNLETNNIIRRLRNVEVTDNSGTVDVNLNYTHAFDKPQQELSVLTQFSRNNRTNDFVNDIFGGDEATIANRLKNINGSFNQENTIQVDYTNPIGKNQILEIGAKQIMRQVISDYETFESVGTGPYVRSASSNLSNKFTYNQNVTGGYFSYTLTTANQYSIKPGLRYEYTTIKADFKNSGNGEVSIPAYGVLVPSINLSKKLKAGNTVKLSYNRRIQRPSLQFLNPNRQAANPLNVTVGNPELDPEYTNNFELGYNTYIDRTSLSFSTYARNTNNSIQSIRNLNGDTIQTTFDNIGQEKAYGFSVHGNVNISNKFTLNAGSDAYYAVLKNNVSDPLYNASNQGWVFNIRGMGSYTLGQGWGLQAFGFYRARQVQLQGSQGGFGVYNLSLRKDINDKKGSLGFGLENFLGTHITIRNELQTPTVVQKSTDIRNNLSFRVNFSYRIGKISADDTSRRRKKSVNNDDMKGGGGDGAQEAGATSAPTGGAPAGGSAPAGGAPAGVRPAGMPNGTQQPGGTPAAGTLPNTKPGVAPVQGAAPAITGQPADATGTWQGKIGDSNMTLNLQAAGDKLTGTITTPQGSNPIVAGKISGNEISFNLEIMGRAVPYKGRIEGDTITLTSGFQGQEVVGALTRVK